MITVALLRGINVGGKNRLSMRHLASVFENAGCEGVRTYIQSGNVVFEASAAVARRVPEGVAAELLERFGFRVAVVTRTSRELRRIVERNPFASERLDPRLLHVLFLTRKPAASAVRSLDPDRSPPDRFAVEGREVYLHCPNGMARTKVNHAYFERKLQATCTARNWNTVLRLLEMA